VRIAYQRRGRGQQLGGRDGLREDRIRSARAQRGRGARAQRGRHQQHHRESGRLPPQRGDQLEAGHDRQVKVREHKVVRPVGGQREGGGGVRCVSDREPPAPGEHVSDEQGEVRVVLNQQDPPRGDGLRAGLGGAE
jgi:hypothetical protein